jgi:hypothetical protein
MKGSHVSCSPGSLVLSGELDLDAAPDITAAGTAIGALIGLNNRAGDGGGQLSPLHVPERVQRVLRTSGLEAVFGLEALA